MTFHELISDLRQAESQLVRQLDGIRKAISSLEMGGAVSPAMPHRGPGRPKLAGTRRRRRLSRKARAAISAAQKARWAKQKAAERK